MSTARAAVLRALISAGEAITVTTLADRLGQHPNTVREHLDALAAAGRVERKRSRPVGRGRPAWLYQAAGPVSAADPDALGPDAISGVGQEYAALAVALIDQVATASPDPRGMARQAGERWGQSLAAQHGAAVAGSAAGDAGDDAPDHPRPSRSTGSGDRDDGGPGSSVGWGAAATPGEQVVHLLDELRFEPQPSDTPGTVRLTTCPLLDAARRNPDVVCEVHLGIVRGVLGSLGGDADAADLVPFAEPGACRLTVPGLR